MATTTSNTGQLMRDHGNPDGTVVQIPDGYLDQITVHPTATIGKDVTWGRYIVIREGATVGNGCKIGNDVLITRGATIGDTAELGAWTQVGDDATVGPGSKLPPGTHVKPYTTVSASDFPEGPAWKRGE